MPGTDDAGPALQLAFSGLETDRYWNAIVGNGGKESECGWCKDRWGLNRQITPRTAAGGDDQLPVRVSAFSLLQRFR
jgi:predicted 3-demethylubiquinone-9 3-methyltransferase (glyoxalase superfamily)